LAEGLTEPSEEQVARALDQVVEEHHAIVFLKKQKSSCMESYLRRRLQKKNPFPKTVLSIS